MSLPISGVCFVVQLDSRHAPVGRRKIQRALLNPVLHRCVESRLHHPPCGADNAARRPRGRTQPPFIVSVAALLPPVYESVQLPDSVRIRYIQEAPYLNDHRFHGCLGLCAFQLAKGAACSCLRSCNPTSQFSPASWSAPLLTPCRFWARARTGSAEAGVQLQQRGARLLSSGTGAQPGRRSVCSLPSTGCPSDPRRYTTQRLNSMSVSRY